MRERWTGGFLRLALAITVGVMLLAARGARGETYALIVACDDYSDAAAYYGGTVASPTGMCSSDGSNILASLVDHYSVPSANITQYTDVINTADEMEYAISELLSNSDATMFVIYFSGHGVSDGTTHSYLCLPQGVFSDARLKTLLARTGVQTVIISDCCYAGGFAVNVGSSSDSCLVLTASSIDLAANGELYSGSYWTDALNEAFQYNASNSWITYLIDWVANLIAAPDPADNNPEDGTVSFEEAFDYADSALTSLCNGYVCELDSDPQKVGGDDSLAFNSSIANDVVTYLTPPSNTTVAPGDLLGPFYSYTVNNTGSDKHLLMKVFIRTPEEGAGTYTTELAQTSYGDDWGVDFTGDWGYFYQADILIPPYGTFYASGGEATYIQVPTSAAAGTHWHYACAYDSSGSLLTSACFSYTVSD